MNPAEAEQAPLIDNELGKCYLGKANLLIAITVMTKGEDRLRLTFRTYPGVQN